MPNGIDLILADHETVDRLFDTFAQTKQGAVVGQIIDALKAHDAAEHAALYPFASEVLDDADVLIHFELAHSEVKRQIDLVAGLEGPPLVAAVEQLRKMVSAHVDDEQTNLLPALTDAATADQLDALGARIRQAKQRGG